MTSCGMFEAKMHFSQLVDSLVSGRTDCVRVSRCGIPVV
jgi:antitoxin (DNA-binding transcriptional repressor) of toxin-antitoxin stability system